MSSGQITGTDDTPMAPDVQTIVSYLDRVRHERGDAAAIGAMFDVLGGAMRWAIDTGGWQAARDALLQALAVLDGTVKLWRRSKPRRPDRISEAGSPFDCSPPAGGAIHTRPIPKQYEILAARVR